MGSIYLDNSATTKVDKKVVSEMLPYYSKNFGNASSLHDLGKQARTAVENSRKKIADYLGVNEKEIIFTSSGTESDNMALKGLALHPDNKDKKHIITSKIEHPAILNTCKALEKQGYKVDYVGVDSEGLVIVDQIKDKISDDTLVVSIMHVNNEIGTIQPIEDIGRLCREKKVYFHTDAVQSFAKIKIPIEHVDLLSASSHKIHGPKGVGLIYIKSGTKISPIIDGGGHEFKLRSSTENVPGIVGFAKAVELSKNVNNNKMIKMRDLLIDELLKMPKSRLNGSKKHRIHSNVNVSFEGIEGEGLLMLLNRAKIYVSTGSACSSKSLAPSHVLLAIGLDPMKAHGSLRITLSKDNTEGEIRKTINEVKKSVERLRRISPDLGDFDVEITSDLSIQEVVSFKPESEQIFLKHGIVVGECIMDMHQSLVECAKEKKINLNSLMNDLKELTKKK